MSQCICGCSEISRLRFCCSPLCLYITHTHAHTCTLLYKLLFILPTVLCLFLHLSAEEEDDAGYLDVAVSEEKHPPPQLSSMPEGLTSHQVHLTVYPFFSPPKINEACVL